MLIDEHNSNILSLFGKSHEGLFNRRFLGLAIHNEEILLGVWRVRDMSNTGE